MVEGRVDSSVAHREPPVGEWERWSAPEGTCKVDCYSA